MQTKRVARSQWLQIFDNKQHKNSLTIKFLYIL